MATHGCIACKTCGRCPLCGNCSCEKDERLVRKTGRIEELAAIAERYDNARMAAMHVLRTADMGDAQERIEKALEILEAAEESQVPLVPYLIRDHARFVEARCPDGATTAEDMRAAAAEIDRLQAEVDEIRAVARDNGVDI